MVLCFHCQYPFLDYSSSSYIFQGFLFQFLKCQSFGINYHVLVLNKGFFVLPFLLFCFPSFVSCILFSILLLLVFSPFSPPVQTLNSMKLYLDYSLFSVKLTDPGYSCPQSAPFLMCFCRRTFECGQEKCGIVKLTFSSAL